MTTAIVGCSKSKIETDTAVRASELYDSPYFNKRLTVASQYDDVRILSAKYGIIDTDKQIEPYNVSIYDLTRSEKESIVETIDTSTFDDTVVVYAGNAYVDIIRTACDDREVVAPLNGGIGEQLSQLNEMIENIGGGNGE